MEIMKLSRGLREPELTVSAAGAGPTPFQSQSHSANSHHEDPNRVVESSSQGLGPEQTMDLAPYRPNFGNGMYTTMNHHSPPPPNDYQRPQPTTEASSAEQRWTLGEFRQMLNVLSVQPDIQEIKEMMISINSRICSLAEQICMLQRQHDYWINTRTPTTEHKAYPHERMPRTPTKVPSTSQHYPRRDLTPESESIKSTSGVDAFGNLAQIKKELPDVENSHQISKLRRTLVYPQAPGVLLDIKNDARQNPRDWLDQSAQNRRFQAESSSPPSFSKDHFTITSIKEEREDDGYGSTSKTSLLMLADIALGSPDEPTRRKIHKVLRQTYRDSGRSSAESCFSSETSDDSDALKSQNKSITKGTYQLFKSKPRSEKLKRPATPDSIEDETASKVDAKMVSRKRRKIKQPLPCSYCGKLFQNQSSLRQHESFHLSVRPFVCEHDNCDKKYKTRSELNRHLVVHSGEKRHLCKLCGKRFLRKQYLKTHLLRHHQTGCTMESSNVELDTDDVSKPKPSTSKMASSTSRQSEKLCFYCKLCMKAFAGEDDLSNHIKNNHEEMQASSVESQDDSDKESNDSISNGNSNNTSTEEDDTATSPVQLKTPTLNIVNHS